MEDSLGEGTCEGLRRRRRIDTEERLRLSLDELELLDPSSHGNERNTENELAYGAIGGSGSFTSAMVIKS